MREQIGFSDTWALSQLLIHRRDAQSSEVSHRVSGSRSGSLASLTVPRLQAEDKAYDPGSSGDSSWGSCPVLQASGGRDTVTLSPQLSPGTSGPHRAHCCWPMKRKELGST